MSTATNMATPPPSHDSPAPLTASARFESPAASERAPSQSPALSDSRAPSETPEVSPSPSMSRSPSPEPQNTRSAREAAQREDYAHRKKERGLLGFQAIADFINATVEGAQLTREHMYPLNFKKTGIVLEAQTERAQALTQHYRNWSVTLPYQEIIEAGELHAKWDELGPRPPPEPQFFDTPAKRHVQQSDSEDDDKIDQRERDRMRKLKKQEQRRRWNENTAAKNQEKREKITAASVLVANYINGKLPGADLTAEDITMTGIWKKGVKVKPLTQRARYIGGRTQRQYWPEAVYTNMRAILDAGELGVSWAVEEVEEPKPETPTLDNGGVMRGLIHRKPGKGHFSGMNKEEERQEKRRIRRRAVEVYTNWLNEKMPEARLTGEKVNSTYLSASGIIVQPNTHRARRIKDSYSTWQMSFCDILQDILDAGEVTVEWDEYGPRECLPIGDDSSDETDLSELSDSELFTQAANTQKTPRLPRRKEWEKTQKQKLADFINSSLPNTSVSWEDVIPTTLRTKCGIVLEGKTDRAKSITDVCSTKWVMNTSIDEILRKGEIVAIRKFEPIDNYIDEDTPIKGDRMTNAYRMRFINHARKLVAQMINDTLPGANVDPAHVSRCKLMTTYGVYLIAKTERAKFFFNSQPTNWRQSTPIEEILKAGELIAKYDDAKKAEIEEKHRVGPDYKPKRSRSVRYPSPIPRRNKKRVKYEESDEDMDDFDETFEEEMEVDESDDESFLQPQLIGKRKCTDRVSDNDSDSSELSDAESVEPLTGTNFAVNEPTRKKQTITTLKLNTDAGKNVLLNTSPMQQLILEQTKRVLANYINNALAGANLTHHSVSPAGLAAAGIRILAATARAAVFLKDPEQWSFEQGATVHDILEAGELIVQWVSGDAAMKDEPAVANKVGMEYVRELIRIAKLEPGSDGIKFAAETLQMRLQMEGMGAEWKEFVEEISGGN